MLTGAKHLSGETEIFAQNSPNKHIILTWKGNVLQDVDVREY